MREHVALFQLVCVALVFLDGIIAIHGIPNEIVVNRNDAYTDSARHFYVTMPIAPAASRVIAGVNVEPNEVVETGPSVKNISATWMSN